MNYHNIICLLSSPTQFHSKINEQLLGCNQRQRAVTPGPLWVSRMLTDQPLAVARERSQQRATHGAQRPHTAQGKGTNDIRSGAARPRSGVISVCAVIMETESVRYVSTVWFIMKTESSSHLSSAVIGHMGKSHV